MKYVGWVLFLIIGRLVLKAVKEHEEALEGDKS